MEPEDVKETQEEIRLHEGLQKVYQLIHSAAVFESPIDIHIPKTIPLTLPKLEWHHLALPPKKVKLTNSGHTVIFSAKWHQERPYLSAGPFIGNYVFSQMHFHWGSTNLEGSEHTISGVRQILEMHVVYFKSCYLTQESALKRKDGIAVVVYMFKLQDEINESIQLILDYMANIKEPQSSTRMKNYPLEKYLIPFIDDYFLYVGSVNTATCVHYVLWLISRVPMGISIDQMEVFRTLISTDGRPLLHNFRDVQPVHGRSIFHINPSGQLHATLLILQKEMDPSAQRMHQTNKYPRSSKEYIDPTGTTI